MTVRTARELKHAADEYLAYCFRYMMTVRVQELAVRLGMSLHEFSDLFLQTLGERPSQYLKQRQIGRAQHLLRTTDLPMKAIARASGFGSTVTLFRSFRRTTGLTPGQYRRRRN